MNIDEDNLNAFQDRQRRFLNLIYSRGSKKDGPAAGKRRRKQSRSVWRIVSVMLFIIGLGLSFLYFGSEDNQPTEVVPVRIAPAHSMARWRPPSLDHDPSPSSSTQHDRPIPMEVPPLVFLEENHKDQFHSQPTDVVKPAKVVRRTLLKKKKKTVATSHRVRPGAQVARSQPRKNSPQKKRHPIENPAAARMKASPDPDASLLEAVIKWSR